MTPPPTFCGFAKFVISGDTIVIRDRAQDGPPSTRTILLAHIVCPKVAKRASVSRQPTLDEPFGWMAREFVRSTVIGKVVYYTVVKEIGGGRAYGWIYLGDGSNAENLAYLLVCRGLAQVRRGISQAAMERNPAMRTLIKLETKAKAHQLGIWSHSVVGAPRHICWRIADPIAFFQVHGRKPLHGVVEFVRDGSTLQIQLCPVDGDAVPTYYNITLLVSGIKTATSRVVGGCRTYEPFCREARFFVESRLLQRDVTVILEGVSGNCFVGSVLHSRGNIALLLLREGLAWCLRWKLAVVSAEAGSAKAYRNAERKAKRKRLRVWQDYASYGAQLDEVQHLA
ncbi:unnamed protein product [Taenia asiatica]|uniref:TNase-like domain-containing protein n=1 Tax=Taenia asiatica TaxID=60517 RepID=A0A0R3VV88_TAEAS|nr:unnamed protein product [Taenia asiatica]